MSAALLSAEPEEDLVCGPDLHIELGGHEDVRRAGGRTGRGNHDAPWMTTSRQDPQPDPQEARHQQEVAEEADVDDFGRDPADEEQLREQQGEGREVETEHRVRQTDDRTISGSRGERRIMPSSVASDVPSDAGGSRGPGGRRRSRSSPAPGRPATETPLPPPGRGPPAGRTSRSSTGSSGRAPGLPASMPPAGRPGQAAQARRRSE